jgi:hypothetical protein
MISEKPKKDASSSSKTGRLLHPESTKTNESNDQSLAAHKEIIIVFEHV